MLDAIDVVYDELLALADSYIHDARSCILVVPISILRLILADISHATASARMKRTLDEAGTSGSMAPAAPTGFEAEGPALEGVCAIFYVYLEFWTYI